MSTIDWSRAKVVMRVPVVHTACETVEEIEVPWEYLVGDEGLRHAQQVRLGGYVERNMKGNQ